MNRISSRTSLNTFAIVLTATAALIFVYAVIEGQKETILIVFLCFIYALLITPYEYTVENSTLKIVRPYHSLTFPLASISKVTLLSNVSQGPSLRVFGMGGLLGYYGFYWFPGMGIAFVLTRNRKNLTLIEFHDHRPIVISPDDSGFLANLGPISIQ